MAVGVDDCATALHVSSGQSLQEGGAAFRSLERAAVEVDGARAARPEVPRRAQHAAVELDRPGAAEAREVNLIVGRGAGGGDVHGAAGVDGQNAAPVRPAIGAPADEDQPAAIAD